MLSRNAKNTGMQLGSLGLPTATLGIINTVAFANRSLLPFLPSIIPQTVLVCPSMQLRDVARTYVMRDTILVRGSRLMTPVLTLLPT